MLQKYDYGYGQIDQYGNLDVTKNNGQLAKVDSYIGAAKQWTQKFKYDSLGRLSEASEQRGDTNGLSYKQTFDFDRFGNLYRKASSNPTAGQENPLPYTAIEEEEADISKSTNCLTSNTIYDDVGNVTQDTKFRNLKFAYDANGRMIKTSNIDDTNQANSVYDASGQRVATRGYDVWKFFIYDAFGRLVSEYGGLSATDEGGIKYVLSDWQSSIRAILSNSGFVRARQDFTTFGEEIGAKICVADGNDRTIMDDTDPEPEFGDESGDDYFLGKNAHGDADLSRSRRTAWQSLFISDTREKSGI